MENSKVNTIWGLLRLGMGWVFLWAFLDKLFGFGFATCRNADTGAIESMCAKAWAAGGSPTKGFLSFGVQGPFADFFKSLAGSPIVDWLFMLGLLFIGLTLILGIMTRLGGYAGAALMILMYLAASIWPANNPFIDDHIIYLLVLLALPIANASHSLGLGRWWSQTSFAQKHPLFK